MSAPRNNKHRWEQEVEHFTQICVRRRPEYDGMAEQVSVYIENDDIPTGYPPFYTDEEGEFE